jgi:hypothetical protein
MNIDAKILNKMANQIQQHNLYTMEFYAAHEEERNVIICCKWMELENIILSEVSLAQKTKNHMFSLTCRH